MPDPARPDSIRVVITTISARVRPVLAVLGVAILTAGCVGAPGPALPGSVERGVQDLNPRDSTTLRDGGDLRLPLIALPENFNNLHLDGGVDTTRQVLWTVLPRVFNRGADGGAELDREYMESAEITSTDPQVVTYLIRPQARWDDGQPITWQDFAAQASALDGTDPAFQRLDIAGYDTIDRVERGAGDNEVRVTFDRPTPEWQGLFSPLYPASTTSDPERFNTGWRDAPLVTAGPFRITTVDRRAGTVVAERNPAWWGTPPRLDRVIFAVTDPGAILDQLANDEIDATEIGTPNGLARARASAGVDIRQAPERVWTHLTFNGAPDRPLADLRLRRAVAQGVDRAEITRRTAGALVQDPPLLGNHILPLGSPGYRDNAEVLSYDPAAAAAELDALGWTPGPDGVRVRDGSRLSLTYVASASGTRNVVAGTVTDQLARIGVEVVVAEVAPTDYFAEYVTRGAFDLVSFNWVTPTTPLTIASLLVREPAGDELGNNVGQISTPQLRDRFAEALRELDDERRLALTDEIDRLLWEQAHSLPLHPSPGVYAVRSSLANWGANGLGDWNYLDVGWMP